MKRFVVLALATVLLLCLLKVQGQPSCRCGPACDCYPGVCPDCCKLTGKGVPYGKISLGGQVGPDGKTEVAIDLPLDQRMRNIGSRVDGLGMCVSTSITHSARWHNLRDWREFRDWCAKYPGGSYPSKTDKQVKQYAQEKGITCPEFLQYEGNDPAIIVAALKAGLCPAITYDGRDGVRYQGHIEHMVNVVYLSRETNLAAIMDNNGKAEDLIWMSFDEFVERWTSKGRGGWVFLWLVPPPPPPPCN